MDQDSYRSIEGVWLHKIFKEENFRSAINYKPREGDIFVASYPKCGTNWTHFIVYNILTRARPVVDLADFRRMCPFIDANGSAVAEGSFRTGPIMTHSPLRVIQRANFAKYIYITRNPYDCAVSYYHFLKGITPKTTAVSFDKFLSLFVAGKTNEFRVTMDAHYYKIIDGLPVPTVFMEENFRSALKYVPRDGDLFVVTYPKCGTKWMQYIVCSILSRGQPPTTVSDLRIMAPFIDLNGAGRAESPKRSGPVVTHLPFHLLRPSKRAKYIYVARNLYDCAVSSYYFAKGFIPTTVEDVSFDRYLPMFIGGKVPYGDYFDHVLPWYHARDEDNVLFVTYEQLKEDTAGQILRIADFIGSHHGAMLRDDADMLNKVVDSCSVRSMRMVHSDVPQERIMRLFSKSCNTTAPSDDEYKASPVQSRHQGSGFVRKGVVGDWKNHFTAEHVALTKAWIADKCKDSDVMKLWENVGLP